MKEIATTNGSYRLFRMNEYHKLQVELLSVQSRFVYVTPNNLASITRRGILYERM